MIIKNLLLNDNLANYDTPTNWDENGNDVTYTSNNDYLDVYKTNSDDASNYIDLTTPFNKIYDFIVEIDFKVINKSDDNLYKMIQLTDGSTARAYMSINLTTPEIEFYDEDDSQIGSTYTLIQNRWFRAKFIQSFNQQTSTTGKISIRIEDLSDPDNNWEFIGTNSSQSNGIDDIRIGHPESGNETFHYQFKNMLVYQLGEFP